MPGPDPGPPALRCWPLHARRGPWSGGPGRLSRPGPGRWRAAHRREEHRAAGEGGACGGAPQARADAACAAAVFGIRRLASGRGALKPGAGAGPGSGVPPFVHPAGPGSGVPPFAPPAGPGSAAAGWRSPAGSGRPGSGAFPEGVIVPFPLPPVFSSLSGAWRGGAVVLRASSRFFCPALGAKGAGPGGRKAPAGGALTVHPAGATAGPTPEGRRLPRRRRRSSFAVFPSLPSLSGSWPGRAAKGLRLRRGHPGKEAETGRLDTPENPCLQGAAGEMSQE